MEYLIAYGGLCLIIARCLRHASQRKRGKLTGVSDFLANRFLMPMFPFL
jgi:hypothetical protein